MTTIAQEQIPTNKHFWYSAKTDAKPTDIWKIWTDVPNWKNWDSGLKDAEINTDFQLDAKGIITSLEGRKSKFKVVEYQEGISYTIKTQLPLSSLYVRRFWKEKDGEIYFTHEVWFKGLTAGIFANIFGEEFQKMLPEVLENIKKIAEK